MLTSGQLPEILSSGCCDVIVELENNPSAWVIAKGRDIKEDPGALNARHCAFIVLHMQNAGPMQQLQRSISVYQGRLSLLITLNDIKQLGLVSPSGSVFITWDAGFRGAGCPPVWRACCDGPSLLVCSSVPPNWPAAFCNRLEMCNKQPELLCSPERDFAKTVRTCEACLSDSFLSRQLIIAKYLCADQYAS